MDTPLGQAMTKCLNPTARCGLVANPCIKFEGLTRKEFEERKAASDMYFLRQGITFNVYHDEKGTGGFSRLIQCRVC